MGNGVPGLLFLLFPCFLELCHFEKWQIFVRLHQRILVVGASLRHEVWLPLLGPNVFVYLVILYDHLTSFLLNLVEEFLGMTPNLST